MKLTKLVKSEVENSTYIKLVVNKTHFGPVSESKLAKKKAMALSAAANKVRITAGFTVKVDTTPQFKFDDEPNSQNRSFVITELGDESPADIAKYALLLMQAWDNVFSSEGSEDYINKLAVALEARANAYKKIGINPTSESKPVLSSDQRVVYNSVVGPTGFDYYEYHLAFKLEGQKKFVRSKTYRSLKPMDLNGIINTLSPMVMRLSNRLTITTKQTN